MSEIINKSEQQKVAEAEVDSLERGLAHELEGAVDLDYRTDGVVCTINFPAPKSGRDE